MINKETKKYDLYIENIFCYAHKGILQAATFIGAVLNSNNNFDIKQWNINEYWELIPTLKIDNKKLLYTFKSFVVKSALCEMMMDFETTLNELYDAILLVMNTKEREKYSIDKHIKLMKKFKDSSFDNKLKEINKNLANSAKNNELWTNLKYVRNCITHNYSTVDKGEIILSIPRFAYTLTDEVTKAEYHNSLEEPIFKIGNIKGHKTTIKMHIDIKQKRFQIGETITFTPSEIYHLIYALDESVRDLEKLCINFFVKNNIEFGITEKNGIIKSQDELEQQYQFKRNLHLTLYPPNKQKKDI